jgi:hypothetical protein
MTICLRQCVAIDLPKCMKPSFSYMKQLARGKNQYTGTVARRKCEIVELANEEEEYNGDQNILRHSQIVDVLKGWPVQISPLSKYSKRKARLIKNSPALCKSRLVCKCSYPRPVVR